MSNSESSEAVLARNLKSRWWRLNNLYKIKDKRGREVTMRWNWAQRRWLGNLHKRNVILKARQLGFTTASAIYQLDLAIFRNATECGMVAHSKPEANKIFDGKIRYAYDRLPEALRSECKARTDRAGELSFDNGSVLRVGVSHRGGTLQFLHVTELGYIAAHYPKRAEEIKAGALPAVPADGIVVLESTAMGAQGLFYDLDSLARRQTAAAGDEPLNPKAWRHHFFPWWQEPGYKLEADTVDVPLRLQRYFNQLRKQGIDLSPEQMAWYTAEEDTLGTLMRREYPSYADEAFLESIEGAYYAEELSIIRAQGQIRERLPVEDVPVHTCWDLGIADSTVIWFYQLVGREIHWIDYYEGQDKGLGHYIQMLAEKARERRWGYGEHWGPHDLAVRELTSGRSRIDVAADQGIEFYVAPKGGLADGIEACRRAIRRSFFDAGHCEQGLAALAAYCKEWDARNGVYRSRPKHDWASHGADAFRYGVVSIEEHGASWGSKHREEDNLEWWMRRRDDGKKRVDSDYDPLKY